jgi:hypothetical protein
MIINSTELLKGIRGTTRDWLCEEILHSLTTETIHSENKGEDGNIYDIKLLVNGVAIEPKLLTKLLEGLESIIDSEAKSLISNRINESVENFETKLFNIIEEVKEASNDLKDSLNKFI